MEDLINKSKQKRSEPPPTGFAHSQVSHISKSEWPIKKTWKFWKNRSLCQKRNRKFHKSVKQPVGYKRLYWPYEPRYTILFNYNLLTPSSEVPYHPSTKWFEISFTFNLHLEVKNIGSKSPSLTRHRKKTVHWTFFKLQPSLGYIKKKLFHLGRKKV